MAHRGRSVMSTIAFLVVCGVHCAEVVGSTSSEGFLAALALSSCREYRQALMAA